MIIQTKDNRQVRLSRLSADDFDKLVDYLQLLSADTRKRFGPHPFDKKSLMVLFENLGKHLGYIGQDKQTLDIIAYSIIKIGYLDHDSSRLRSYGLEPDPITDCTFAPSVADQWQGMGIGNSLFGFMLSDLKAKGIKRVILWGGVQCDNLNAVDFYLKHGFRTVGQFEYNGWNWDMILDMV